MVFLPSEGTVGVEYELQLLDAGTLDLVDAVTAVLSRFPKTPYIKPELVQSTVEITTPVCARMSEVAHALRDTVSQVRAVCEALELRLSGAGTHAFCERLGTITPLPRYLDMASRSGILAKAQVTLALQVHVGMGSAREAVTAMQELHCYLPVLLALSASSPFWHGYDTGYASWRHRILASARTYGIPPRFEEWSDVERYFRAGLRAAIFESWRDLHWDIRPRPDYGTIEIRVMDAPTNLTEAMALATFARALTIYLIRTPAHRRPAVLPRPLPWWMERENHFEASRVALGAPYVASDAPVVVRPLREVVEATIESVAPIAYELGDGGYLEPLWTRILSHPSYTRQRRVRRLTHSPRAVMAALAHELDADLDLRRIPRSPRETSQRPRQSYSRQLPK